MEEIIPFVDQDNDFILVGSMSQMNRIPKDADWNKVILYNWDHYKFIDMANRPDWVRFHQMCKKAREVWMPTKTHADYYLEYSGVRSFVLNLACVLPHEWGKTSDSVYAMMSSRPDGYKRFDMFKKACAELNMPFIATHPGTTSRQEYIDSLSNCRFYVQASIDESLGGLSLMEAVWNRKPVLISDSIKGGIEVYGDTIEYFKSEDFNDFKAKLSKMFDGVQQPDAFNRIKNQTPQGVAELINQRICTLKKFI